MNVIEKEKLKYMEKNNLYEKSVNIKYLIGTNYS